MPRRLTVFHISARIRGIPNHLFALGYGGNGMTASFLAATLLLKRYQTMGTARASNRTLDLFAFRRRRR